MPTIGDFGQLLTRERFIQGMITEPDSDGVLAGVLVASSRGRCVVEA